ncbi:MAG: methylated-DNA--[protein]-cysteine S-methyltransferase [Fluviibacter sp.]
MKPAAKSNEALDTALPLDSVLRLGDIAPQAPANLRDVIYLGIRLTPEGDALDEIAWLVGQPRQPANASVCARRDPLLENIRQQLGTWFTNPSFVFQLPLATPRTAFQSRLRDALCATRPRETLTYGALAKQLSSAPRAVGQALGSNPLPIVVPCHRIISAGKNRLTGFSHTREGPLISLKAWLLEHEAAI